MLAVLGLVGLAAAMVWQHLRYLRARRDVVQDHQPALYASAVFHVITLLRVTEGADPIEEVRKLRDQLETATGPRLIYAGKVAVNALSSSQLGDVSWSAAVLVQYPSKQAHAEVRASEGYKRALSGFAQTYSHGLERDALRNLMVPQLLLALRVRQLLSGAPSHFPFEPDPDHSLPAETAQRMERLLGELELGAEAVVVVNLLKHGTPEQRVADRAYGMRMAGMFAEGAHGPMHIGDAVTLEGGARFDRVALVYYPGVEHFAAMGRSRFFQGIVGGKQLGDTQASVTVPMLDRL